MSTLATIREHGLIAVIDTPIKECVVAWGIAVSKGGIELLGIPASLENVTEVASDLYDANLTVGLPNLTDPAQLSIAVAACSEFLISPITCLSYPSYAPDHMPLQRHGWRRTLD